MSFSVFVPCNCYRNGNAKLPPFTDKLRWYHGELDLKEEYLGNFELMEELRKWKFCEHYGIAIEFDMVQSIIGWREFVRNKYPAKFPNFEKFIPAYNMYINKEYDKLQTMVEIKELNKLENYKHTYRFEQFKKLLSTAINNEQEIYW